MSVVGANGTSGVHGLQTVVWQHAPGQESVCGGALRGSSIDTEIDELGSNVCGWSEWGEWGP